MSILPKLYIDILFFLAATSDYEQITEELLTFSRENTLQCTIIKITDDFVLESTENFNVLITPGDSSITILTLTAVITIVDNDMVGIGLEEEEYEVTEDQGSVEVCVVVTSGSIQRQLVATLLTADISAGKYRENC